LKKITKYAKIFATRIKSNCELKAKGVTFLAKVFFFFDDSGVFHRKSTSDYFVYAGFVFCSLDEMKNAKRKYISSNKKIKTALGYTGELKASILELKHRRALFKSVEKFDSLSVTVKLSDIYDYILDDKKSICRYKDYILKILVKKKLEDMIKCGKLKKDEDIKIFINIDEQLTASNGYYSLGDSIKEELKYGIHNFDYLRKHKNIFDGNVEVYINYLDSSKNYLIQASDILANRIWNSYRFDKPEQRKICKHLLEFP